MPSYTSSQAKQHMLEGQLLPFGIKNFSLLSVMKDVPRELFVPEKLKSLAYSDALLPVGSQRFLLSPTQQAQLLESLFIKSDANILDIGSLTGYSSALLGKLAPRGKVVALESNSLLADMAVSVFEKIGMDHVKVLKGSLAVGCPDHAPFNVICINGAVPYLPQIILDQLADDGQLVVGLEQTWQLAQVVRYKKTPKGLECSSLFEIKLPLLPGFDEDYHVSHIRKN